MSNDLDARIKVGADTREAEAGIDRVNDKVTSMGDSASKAGAKASTALDGMGKSSEAAATKFTRSESAMGVALRRTVEQMEIAVRQGKSLADAFQIKADIRGFDASKFDPMLDRLRQLESQLSVAKAAEEEFAAQNAFAKKRQQATELVKAAQYTSWWAVELEKVDAAERKLAAETAFVSSLKAQAAAIGKTRADLLELQAAQMGVTSQAAPFIAKLREAETGMAGAGMSTRAMSAAMRGVPAQISDIVVSLQGGMPIMTVFMQQGFQLRDMFGGFGPAGKALAATLVSLVNPYTVAAAAVVALGAAMYYTEDKLRTNMALMAQLEATGRAGYLNSDAIKQLKKDMTDLPGISKSMASSIIADLVQVRTLGGEALQKIALLSADFAVATSQTAADAAKELAKAMEDPAKAAKALDEAFNFLTVEQLIAIDAMVEAGEKAGAQKMLLDALGQSLEGTSSKQTDLQVATKELSNAWDDLMGNMSPSAATMLAISEGLGGMVRGVNGLTDAIPRLNAWITQWGAGLQAMMGPLGMLLRVQGLQTLGAEANGGASKPPVGGGGGRGSVNPPLAGVGGAKSTADQELAELLDSTKGFKAKKDAADELGKTLSRLQAQQERLRKEGKGDSKAADEVQARIDGVTEKIKTLSKTRGDGSKKEQSAYAELAASIQAKIDVNKAEFEFSGKLSEAQKAEIKLNTDLKEGKIKLSAAHEADLRTRIEEWKQQEKAQEKAKQNVAMYTQQLDIEKQLTEDYVKRSKALESARLAMDAYEKAAQEDHERLQLEAGLIGMSNQARAVALAQYDAEVELKRKIEEIDSKLDATQPEKEELRDRARVVAAKRLATAGSKAYLDEWKSSVDKYDDIFSHGFADMLNNGKDGWKSFNKSLVTTFKTSVADQIYKMFLRPFVVNVVGNLMGVEGSLTGAAGGLGGGSNLIGLAQNASSLYNTGSTVAGWLGFGGSAAASGLGLSAGAGVGLSAASAGSSAIGAGIGMSGAAGWGGIGAGAATSGLGITASSAGAGAIGAGIGTSAAATGAGAAAGAGSAMSGVLAAAPYLAAAVALYAIIKGMDDSGTPHSGAGAVYSQATGVQSGAEIYNQGTFGMGHRDEYSADMQAGISGIAQGLGQTLDSFAVSFGKTAGYSVATAFADDSSKDGSWGSLKIADELGKVLVNWEDSRASKWAPREFADGEDGYKEYLNAVAVDVKAAFLTMDLPAWANQALKAATDIDTLTAALQQIATVKSVLDGLGKTMAMFAGLSGDLQTRLLAASGGVEALASNAGAFYESFYTEGERALKQRELQMSALAAMGLYIDPAEGDAAKAIFKKTVLDAMASDQVELAAKLMAMSGNFGQMADYAQKVLDEMAETAKAAAEVATKATQEFAQGVATQMASAYSAMNSAGDLLDKINGAQGGPGNGYGLLREQRLWASMAEADYKQQIELAGELTDMVLGRHQIEQANAQKLLDFGRSLRGYVDGLKIGALSPLTMGEKLAEAAKQYAATLAKAQAGDETAMSALQGASTSYLDLARQYFASGDDYTKIFNSVTGSLDALGLSSQTEAQLQLDVSSQSLAQLRQLQGIVEGAYAQAESEFDVEKDLLQRQVDELLRTANGIEAVRDLLGGMPAELATLLNGGAATGTGSFATLAQSYVSLLGGAGGSSTDARYVAQAMGHMDSANWKAELNNAMGLLTDPGARAQMQAIFDAVAKMKGIDGSHADGLGYVPFDNYIAQLHRGERVLTAEENRAYRPTWSSYGRGGGVEALVSEVKALRTEVSQLRKENREDSQIVARATVESNMAAAGDVVNGVGQATVRAAYAETVQPKGYK